MNFSSHGPEFFTDLLSGRVWLFERGGKVGAVYFGSDGDARGCWMNRKGGRYFQTGEDWRWSVGIRVGGTKLELSRRVKGRQATYGLVPIYDGETGRLHGERFDRSKKKWFVTLDGWVEERWPGGLKRVCPGLSLPESLEAVANDGDVAWRSAVMGRRPVVRHRGWKDSFPGAVGLGASGGKPTLTLEALTALVGRMHGTVAVDINGEERVVLVRGLDGELWQLGDGGEIGETAALELVRGGTVIVANWRPSGAVTSWYVGYPFPLRPTGRRYAAFRMMDALAAERRRVTVRLRDGGERTVGFLAGGKLLGGGSKASWRLTHGTLALSVDGEALRFPWKRIAEMTGWRDGE